MSVSTLIVRMGAATPVSVVNFCMGFPLNFRCRMYQSHRPSGKATNAQRGCGRAQARRYPVRTGD
ncbi:hypothetical protein, partial [Stenotrophomonas maltophilia]|uniref:hypothetical protein n=1 Tax=Stenotrophomonas maltophilia TaxID=40324 RepID=UPI00195357D9